MKLYKISEHRFFFNCSGLTLQELVITIAVVGILSASSLPVCRPFLLSYKVNAETRNMATNLLWARMKAISEQNNFVILFHAFYDSGSDKYEIFSDDNNNGIKDLEEENREFLLLEGIRFASNSGILSPFGDNINETDGVTFSSNALTFTPRGSASESGSIYLVPEIDISPLVYHNRGKAITVTRTTGSIRIWKYSLDNIHGPWE